MEEFTPQFKKAHDRLELTESTPPKDGVFPEFRFAGKWWNVAWLALPVLIIGCAMLVGSTWILETHSWQNFVRTYPGTVHVNVIDAHGFPWWLRLSHLLNLSLMILIIRSGVQILADHPRLYWNRDSTPGSEWFRFQYPVPKGVLWTAKDDAVTIPGWLGIPGIRHSIGLARWWHFSFDLFWLINGIVFYVFLFTTHQWERLVPMSWDVFPNALSMAQQYLALAPPPTEAWIRYNSLQQLAYFTTVFIAAPAAAFFGLMQAPAIANKFGFLGKPVNRQVERSIHFFIMLYFVGFIVVHVSLVFITGMRKNLNHITLGTDNGSWEGAIIAFIAIALLAAFWLGASPFTLK